MTPIDPSGPTLSLAAEHSDAPWTFLPLTAGAPSDGAQSGWIVPHGAGDDDPCVAYLEQAGALDLAAILAAPELLAATEALCAEVEGLLCGEVPLPLATRTTLAACLGPAEAAITRARSRMPVGGN
jgi:hypothetical protein